MSACSTCHKPQTELTTKLARCGGCLSSLYCSRQCQLAAWADHKVDCRISKGKARSSDKGASDTAAVGEEDKGDESDSNSNTPVVPVPPLDNFTRHRWLVDSLDTMDIGGESANFVVTLDNIGGKVSSRSTSQSSLRFLIRSVPNNAYLSHLSPIEAKRQLIDCFRMKCEDEFKLNNTRVGLYNLEDPTYLFQIFLDLAEKRKVVPDWWTKKDRSEVEQMGQNRQGDRCIYHNVEKKDIMEEYKDEVMPMKMRGAAERIYKQATVRF